jgi:hypothetical protein
LGRFRLLYLAPVFALIALMAWALASPVGSSPDDDFHLASIWCANAANTAACKPGPTPGERVVPLAVHGAACFARQPTVSAACAVKFLSQDSKPTVTTDRGSFQNNYPPVYYATMSLLVGASIPVSVLLMRLLNIVLLIGITTALYVLLPRARRPALLWGWILSTLPLGLFLIASNNPSSWAIIGIGSAWIALLGFFETTGRRKIGLGVLFGLAATMAEGSRADSALYLVLSVVVVLILTFVKTRSYLLSAILPVAFSVTGIAFFLSAGQSSVTSNGLAVSGDGTSSVQVNTLTLIFKDLINVPQLWAGVFGTWDLGWLDTAMPALVSFAGVVAFVGFAYLGLTRLWWRKSVGLVLVALALWLIPTYVLVKGLNEVGQNVQPRYLLPLIVFLAGLMMISVGKDRVVIARPHLILVAALLAIGQSLALYFNMRRYITGIDGHNFNLDANMGWWWNMAIPPMAVWVLGSLAFAALLIVLIREMSKSDALE